MTVHHVNVNAIGPGPLRFGNLLSQAGKGGVEDRRGQLDDLSSQFANLTPSRSANLCADVLKNIDKLPVSARDLGDGVLARDLLRPHVNEGIPETGPAHGETDEAWNAGRSRQPFAHFFVIFAPA